MNYLFFFLLILAGLIAMSGVIAAKRPDARAVLDKLVPFQALIGVALLGMSIVFVMVTPFGALIKGITKGFAFTGALALIQLLTGIVLGFLFGLPMLARLGGNHAKAQELAAKVAPFTVLLGMVALGGGIFGLLYALGIGQQFLGA